MNIGKLLDQRKFMPVLPLLFGDNPGGMPMAKEAKNHPLELAIFKRYATCINPKMAETPRGVRMGESLDTENSLLWKKKS